MFSKVTSAIRNESARKQARQENIARIAISEDGQIAYASSAFCALSHREAGELKNARAMDLISFLEGPRASAGVGQIKAGLHKIYINGHKEPMSFHFDWLSTPDNKRYLIGSENLGNKKPDRATIEQMAGMIQPTQQGFSIEDLERLMNISHEAMIVVNDLGEIEQANTHLPQDFRLSGPRPSAPCTSWICSMKPTNPTSTMPCRRSILAKRTTPLHRIRSAYSDQIRRRALDAMAATARRQ
jgi:hypothetical protein